jgi:hypothetical protein
MPLVWAGSEDKGVPMGVAKAQQMETMTSPTGKTFNVIKGKKRVARSWFQEWKTIMPTAFFNVT